MARKRNKQDEMAEIEALREELDSIFAYLPTDEVKRVTQLLATLSPNAYIYAVDQAARLRGEKMDRFIADAVAADIQASLAANGYVPKCPECGYGHPRKDGKRGATQRYRCQKCGRRFTATNGSILEKTRYTWAVWVEVVFCLLNGIPLRKTQKILADDLHCPGIELNTIHLMRLKVMNAIASIPTPKLSGVIQIDDMYLREDQKGSRELVDPLPADISPGREPHSGYFNPSQLGIRGGEYSTVTCMVDSSGKCVIRCLGMGAIPEDVMRGFIEEHTEPGSISFACSDADGTYAAVFSDMNVPHYIRPSDYLKTIEAAGYEKPSKVDPKKAARQWERDQRILEKLWEAGEIDRIENRGKMTYREFASLKEEHGLNISAVNSLHGFIRQFVEAQTRGVSTKTLPLYLGFFEYIRNLGIKAGEESTGPIASHKDAERILAAAVDARVNLTASDLAGMRAEPLPLEGPSGKYVHELARRTREAREATGDDTFRFGAEDGIESFNVRKLLRSLSYKELRTLGKQTALHDWRRRNQTLLIEGLAKMEGIEGILLATIVAKKRERTTRADAFADDRKQKKAAGGEEDAAATRKVVKGTFTRAMLRRFDRELLDEVEAGSLVGHDGTQNAPVLFFDVESTGTSVNKDEVLSLAIISLQDGEVVFEEMFRPLHKQKWPEAEEKNGISPTDVEDCSPLLAYKPELDKLFASAGLIVGWNSYLFDTRILFHCGIDMPRDAGRYLDLMEEFAAVWNAVPGRTRQQELTKKTKLVHAAAMLALDGYTPEKQHTAAGDAAVLVSIWNWMSNNILALCD